MDHELCIPLPDNEDQRIKVLYQTQLLDTLPEEIYDRYTAFAKRIFKIPVALVSLVDHQRQWFKSRVGLDAQQTHRNVAFCSYVVLEKTPSVMVVSNALEDERFQNNPLVTGAPYIRFYAGAALVIDGVKIGTLCVIDQQPRSFSIKDEEKLLGLAEIVRDFIIERRNSYLKDLSRTLTSVSPILQPLKLPLESYQTHFQQLVAISKENNRNESEKGQRTKQIERFREKVQQVKDQMLQLSYINESVIQVLLMYSKLENWIGDIPEHFDLFSPLCTPNAIRGSVRSSPSKEENERNSYRHSQLNNYFGQVCSPLELMKELKDLHFEQQPSSLPLSESSTSDRRLKAPAPLISSTSRLTKRQITFSSHRSVPSISSSSGPVPRPATAFIDWIVEDPSFLHRSIYTYSPVLRLILSLFTKLRELEACSDSSAISQSKGLKLKIIQSSTNSEEGNLALVIVNTRSCQSSQSSLARQGSSSMSLSLTPPPVMNDNSSSILSGLFSALDHLITNPSSSGNSSFLNTPAVSSSKVSEITSQNSSYRSSFSLSIRNPAMIEKHHLPPVDEANESILFHLTIPYFIYLGPDKHRSIKPVKRFLGVPLSLPTRQPVSSPGAFSLSSVKQNNSIINDNLKQPNRKGRRNTKRILLTVPNFISSIYRTVFPSKSARISP